MIEKEQFYVLPRMELCEAKVGQTDTERCLGSKWWLQNLKLAKKVTAAKEGAGPPLPSIVVE